MPVRRIENILIVVNDLEAVRAFFLALGLKVEGEMTVGGEAVDRLIGLQNTRATLVFMSTPDGSVQIELDKFHSPPAIGVIAEKPPVNALGLRRIMLSTDHLDETVARVVAAGAEQVGEVVQYGQTFRLAYVRGPEGLIVGLGQAL